MSTAPHPPPSHRWRAGDLFVHPATADQDVEWLILPLPPEAAQVRVVAADTEPLAGVGDLELPPDSPLAPLVIRCSASCRLDRSALDAAVPTGHLEEPWPRTALELSDGLEHGQVRGTPLEREAEDDSELRHRRRVLDEARRMLAEAGARGPAPRVVTGPWRPTPTALWQAAAGILLAACLGLGWLSFDLLGRGDAMDAAPRAFGVGEALNESVRMPRSSVIAADGFWQLYFVVTPDQAPEGFVVEVSNPLGPGTEPLEIGASRKAMPQVIVQIPDGSLVPGPHRVRLVDRRDGTVIYDRNLTFHGAPSEPSAAPAR